VPHLDANAKRELLASIPPYQRDARSKGIPQLGSGAIYPIEESEITVPPVEILPHWKRAYGLDVGWNRTAAIWIAHDPDADIVYITHEYERGQAEPAVHAAAIRARGEWMMGAIDPASRGRSQHDGTQLMQSYEDLGLTLVPADNAVEAGLFGMLERMSSGRLKVFSTCTAWLREFRLYRRDERGHVVKKDDHLMDASRYAVRSGLSVAQSGPSAAPRGPQTPVRIYRPGSGTTAWMA
jgi:hypothetical protein